MNPTSSFTDRIFSSSRYLVAVFVAGLSIAVWDPHPKLILTVAIGLSTGMLILGPYSSAALYGTRLQSVWHGHLRWAICLILSVSAVFIMDYLLEWSKPQLAVAIITSGLGTVMGHDATLAVLELKASRDNNVDVLMVILFPLIVGGATLAGYCSLAFGIGIYHLVSALIR